VTIATATGGRQRTSTDGLSQAARAAALAVHASSWLRDEEASFGRVAWSSLALLGRTATLNAAT